MKHSKGTVVSAVLAIILTSWPVVSAQEAGRQRSQENRGSLLIDGAPANSDSKSVRIIGTTQGNTSGGQRANRSGNRNGERRGRDGARDKKTNKLDTGVFDSGFGELPFAYGYPYGYLDQQYSAASAFDGNTFELGYVDGFDAGNLDRIQGNLYNPRQYERSGDPDYFEGFVAGYRDGFRR